MESPRTLDDLSTTHAELPVPRRRRLAIGLRTMLLLIATLAVWISYVQLQREMTFLKARVSAQKNIAHELIVNDPTKIAVVMLARRSYEDKRWDVHLPADTRKLCLATRGFLQGKPATDYQSVPIEPGRHLIEFQQSKQPNGWQNLVLLDGRVVLRSDEPLAWNPESGWGESSLPDGTTELDPTNRLSLLDRVFQVRISPNSTSTPAPGQPANGVRIWIEP